MLTFDFFDFKRKFREERKIKKLHMKNRNNKNCMPEHFPLKYEKNRVLIKQFPVSVFTGFTKNRFVLFLRRKPKKYYKVSAGKRPQDFWLAYLFSL